jgi:glutamate-1-semialdehyde 2,1-aminomutase
MGRRRDELLERAGGLPQLRSHAGGDLMVGKAQGARIYDVDNVGYIDYTGASGAAIVGHANQFVLDAVKKALLNGVPGGLHVPQEVELAESLAHFLPWVGSWWFCRHSDDAMVHALEWARRATGRDSVLALAGGAPLVHGRPEPPGAGGGAAGVREVPGWDLDRIEAALVGGASKLAALVVDPLLSGLGVIPPSAEVLAGIADACCRAGVPLVLDERVSGFRVSRGGAAAWAGIEPDVAVYGGALGGGFPIGAVAFSGRIASSGLEAADPVPIPHPVVFAAAEAVLSILKNDSVYERLESRAQQLEEGMLALAVRFSRPMVVNRLGSAFSVFMSRQPVVDEAGVHAADGSAYVRLADALLSEGVLLPRQPARPAFLSSSHGAKEVDETLVACERVLMRLHQEDLP